MKHRTNACAGAANPAESAQSMIDPTAPLILFPNACPCCGYDTIDGRGDYDICTICWWEDDGQDNDDANIVRGGPNSTLSLSRARLNFLQHGISQPSRQDLRVEQDSIESHLRQRIFEFDSISSSLSEPATGWSTTIAELDDDPRSPYFSIGAFVIYRRRWLDADPQPGVITTAVWDDSLKHWRYRLNDAVGKSIEQWYDGASLKVAGQNDE